MTGGPPTGVLLINVGTPDAPDVASVRRYLREFLSDPYVIDIHPIARWLLLHLVILPRRPAVSAAAYQKVWTDEGSPLRVHGLALAKALEQELGDGHRVVLGMRYGSPSIRDGLEALSRAGARRIVVFPLYPQYASSSTETSLVEVRRVAATLWEEPDLAVVPPFFDDEGLVRGAAELGAPILEENQAEYVLFSFHGLPERHIRKQDASGRHCLAREGCCDQVGEANANCYRAQCFATARALAARLELAPDTWSVSFQSRLGRTPWITPHTDVILPQLAQGGVRRVAVFCAAFVADCLETLEEIGIRAKADFEAHGGEDLRLVPAVNTHPTWVRAAARLVRSGANKAWAVVDG